MSKKAETIEEQAKRIMDSFFEALSKVEQPATLGLRRDKQVRTPKKSVPDERFRLVFFANAPKVKDDLLVAEKKQW